MALFDGVMYPAEVFTVAKKRIAATVRHVVGYDDEWDTSLGPVPERSDDGVSVPARQVPEAQVKALCAASCPIMLFWFKFPKNFFLLSGNHECRILCSGCAVPDLRI